MSIRRSKMKWLSRWGNIITEWVDGLYGASSSRSRTYPRPQIFWRTFPHCPWSVE